MRRYNLELARRDLDLTQVETAKRLDISKQQYSRIESGESNGSVEVWQKLSELFGKTINYLLEQEEEPQRPTSSAASARPSAPPGNLARR